MRKKIVMTIALCLSLSTMLLSWFGSLEGVQEVSGLLLLDNPIAVACIMLSFIGIWTDYRHSEIIGSIGMIGMIVMEIYELFTWHILTLTGHFDFQLSLDFAYPGFWFALFCIMATYLLYKKINKSKI